MSRRTDAHGLHPDTGAVLHTELSCTVPKPWSVSGLVTVTYAMERHLGLNAPVRIAEQETLSAFARPALTTQSIWE